jgi:hypothetical protein
VNVRNVRAGQGKMIIRQYWLTRPLYAYGGIPPFLKARTARQRLLGYKQGSQLLELHRVQRVSHTETRWKQAEVILKHCRILVAKDG